MNNMITRFRKDIPLVDSNHTWEEHKDHPLYLGFSRSGCPAILINIDIVIEIFYAGENIHIIYRNEDGNPICLSGKRVTTRFSLCFQSDFRRFKKARVIG